MILRLLVSHTSVSSQRSRLVLQCTPFVKYIVLPEELSRSRATLGAWLRGFTGGEKTGVIRTRLAESALELCEQHQFPQIAAQSLYVLGHARAQLDRATLRGLTIATAIPAAASALATGVSKPPVASRITKSARHELSD